MQEQELVNAARSWLWEQLKNVDVCVRKTGFRWAFPQDMYIFPRQILRPCSEKAMNCIKRKVLWAGQYTAQECVTSLEQSSVPSRISVFWDKFRKQTQVEFLRRMQ